MKDRLRPATLALVGQMLLVGLFLTLTGRLDPVRVPDTHLYTEFTWDSPAVVLGNIRAPGYAAFLAIVAPGENLTFVPAAHYVTYCLAVLIFSAGLRRMGGIADGPRMWVASALLYANILHGYLATVASDTLAAALAVASVGLLFLAIKSRGYLVPLALCVMATWLVRPAYLSMVVQLPLLGTAIVFALRGERPSTRALARTAFVLTLVTVIPLFAYCMLRSVVVGRFGVVASGGFNLIGISGQFLDEKMVDALSDDLQPLARLALSRSESADESDPVLMTDAPILNYQRMENRYDHTIWNIFYPAAEETDSSEVSSVNTRLRRLAQEIIRKRPTMYAVYLIKAFRRAVFKIVGDTVLNPYCLGLCVLIAGGILCRILGPASFVATDMGELSDVGDGHSAAPVKRVAQRIDMLSLMTLTALSFAAFQMAVVILVCPPLGRMTDAMALFVPPLLMAFLVDRVSPFIHR